MKHIIKNKKEPQNLKIYRETTPNATYSGFSKKENLRTALLNEQGYICAYCMKRISLDLNENYKPKIEIEHYKSQEKFPAEELNYKNMLGVCNGNASGTEHCDKSRKCVKSGKIHSVELKRLNPLNKDCEELITYTLNGEIKSISNNQEVEDDIKTLNLNNEYLIDYRKIALDKARKEFNKNNSKKHNKLWTKKMFDKEIERYKAKNQKGRYKEYCQFIIWNFQLLKSRKKYS